MANKLRIHVKFGGTKVLVPCGDGSILISDMVDKAIGKYKKANKLHEDDRVVIIRLYQEGGCVVDMDDDVCDVFDDKEMVYLEYQFYPHDCSPDFVPMIIGGFSDPSTAVTTNNPNQPQATTPPTKPHPISNGNPHKHTNMDTGSNPPLNKPSPSMSSSYIPPPDSGYQGSRYGTGSDQSPPPDILIRNGDDHQFQYGYNDYEPIRDGDNDNDFEKLPNEFEPDDQHDTQSDPLSQVIDDPVNTFSDIDHVIHPTASQISVHSFEGASQPSLGIAQRFTHSPTSNYNILTPPQGYHNTINPYSVRGQQSSVQQGTETRPDKGNLDSPNLGDGSNFRFTTSRSTERLNDIQNGGRTMSLGMDSSNQSSYRNNNNNSYHPPQMSQDPPYSHGHGSHDNYSMPHDQYNMNMMVMSQVDQLQWPPRNPRMYSNMAGYPPRGGPPQMRGSGYGMEYGNNMRPDFDRSSVSSDYDFRNPYQSSGPSMYSQQQFMEKDKRRKQSMQEEGMKMGRGPPHHLSPPYPDMFAYQHQRQYYHAPEEDPTYDVTLSQPATYMMYPPQQMPYRYQNFQPPMPPQAGGGQQPGMSTGHMNPGRLNNVPSGYSLSQGGVPRMKNFGFDKMPNKPRKSVLRNGGGDRKSRSDSVSKDNKYSIDEELVSEEDGMKPSPFRRSSRKSMFLDDGSVWGRWQDKLADLDFDEYSDDELGDDIPHQIGDSSQRTNTPPSDDGKEKEEPVTDLGHLHIVELLREDEPLGIQLVSYNSKGRDLGVFIGEMDRQGFAAKSGELQLFDRILACNGEDFTNETNRRVEERLREMTSKEPLLRMAVSRGLNLDLDQSQGDDEDDDITHQDVNIQNGGTSQLPGDDVNTVNEDNRGSVAASTPTMVSTSVTNTRQLGIRKTIELTKKGTFGFGLSSRDVATNNDDIPIYIKSITAGGAAFHDGRLKIGDRILEVNGVSVKGLSQSDVIDILRNSDEHLIIVISRQQQTIEPQDEYSELSQPIDQGPLPAPIGKNVMVVNIPLDDCGLHGLGVTVYGRCSRKKAEDVGIYIKGVQPGGAAAKEGSLRVNDRLLSVNNQSLVNMSNSSALEALKKGLQQANPGDNDSIHLTIARTAGINRKLSLSMSSFSTQMPALQEEERGIIDTTEIGIDCPPELRDMSQEIDHTDTLYEDEYNFISQTQTSSGSQLSYGKPQEVVSLSVGSYPGSQAPFSNSSKPDYEATSNHVINTKLSPPKIRRNTKQITSESGIRNNHHRRDYENERIPKHSINTKHSLPLMHSDASKKYTPMRHSSLSPTMSEQVTWMMVDPQGRGSSTSRGSSDSPSYSRPSSIHSEVSDRSSTQGYNKSHRHSSNGPLVYGHARVGSGSFRRKMSPPYDTLERTPTKERKQYDNDSSSSHTLPKQTSGRNLPGRTTPTHEDATSLYSYSSDPDLSKINPFQRDDINRKSIPKKKSSVQPNLSHLKFNNIVPRLEGEGPPSPPLYRTGSDGDLSVHNLHYLPKEMFNNVEVGPNLRMAKSSSLESLQTVMHYTIRSDIREQDHRGSGRGTRSSFRRAVDRSYSGERLPSSAVISSVTKSPQKRKQQKKGIFSWIKTRKTKGGNKKDKNRRPDSCIAFDPIGDIAKQYGISEKTILRMQSHSGKLEGDDDLTSDEDDDDEDDYDSSFEMQQSLQNSRAL